MYTDGLIEGRVGAGDERLDVPGLAALLDGRASGGRAAGPARLAGRPGRGRATAARSPTTWPCCWSARGVAGDRPVATAAGRLRRRVTALCLVVGVVLTLIAAGAAAAVAAQNRTQLDTLLDKTGPLRAGAQELLTALVDQETGVRGYAVSGDRDDLDPYTRGRRRPSSALIAAMRGAARPTSRRSASSSTRVEQLADAWRADRRRAGDRRGRAQRPQRRRRR